MSIDTYVLIYIQISTLSVKASSSLRSLLFSISRGKGERDARKEGGMMWGRDGEQSYWESSKGIALTIPFTILHSPLCNINKVSFSRIVITTSPTLVFSSYLLSRNRTPSPAMNSKKSLSSIVTFMCQFFPPCPPTSRHPLTLHPDLSIVSVDA